MASFSFQVEEENKKHREEKNCREGRELTFFRFYIRDEALLLPSPFHIPSKLSSSPSSSLVSHISSKLCGTEAQELS
jgi:hypothetical protein